MAENDINVRIRALLEGLEEIVRFQTGVEGVGQASQQASDPIDRLGIEMDALAQEFGEAAPDAQRLAQELRGLGQQQQLINTFRQLKQANQATNAELTEARQRARELAQALKASEQPSKALATQFEAARQKVRLLTDAEQEQRAELQRLRQSLAGTGTDTRKLGAANAELGNRLKATAAQAEAYKQKILTSDEAVERHRQRVERLKTSVFSLRNAMQAAAASFVLREFVQANTNAQGLERTLTVLTGSAELAGQELEYVRDVANRLGLEAGTTARSYADLLAATQGTALAGEPARAVFEAISTAMATLGRSSFDTELALTAIEQMISKGTVSAEELRGQLGERLPGAFRLAADAMGLTTEALNEQLQQGNILAEDLLPRLAQRIRETYGDTSRVESFQASLNRLRNTVNEVFVALGDTGALDAFGRAIQGTALAAGTLFQGLEALGQHIANLFFTVTSLDFGGWWAREQEILNEAQTDIGALADKILGVGDAQAETAKDAAKLDAALTKTGAAAATAASNMEGLRAGTEAVSEQTATLDENFKTIGLSLEELATGIDEKSEQILTAFAGIAESSEVTGETLVAAFERVADSVTSVEALEAAVTSLDEAAARGAVTSEQYARAMEASDQALQRLTGDTAAATREVDTLRGRLELATDTQRAFAAELANAQTLNAIAALSAEVTRLYESGRISAAEYEQAMEAIRAKYRDLMGSSSEARDGVVSDFREMERAAESAADAISDVGRAASGIGGSVADAAGGVRSFGASFQEIFDQVGSDIFALQALFRGLSTEQLNTLISQYEAWLRENDLAGTGARSAVNLGFDAAATRENERNLDQIGGALAGVGEEASKSAASVQRLEEGTGRTAASVDALDTAARRLDLTTPIASSAAEARRLQTTLDTLSRTPYDIRLNLKLNSADARDQVAQLIDGLAALSRSVPT